MLTRSLEKSLRRLGLNGHSVLVAVSGGIDSTVLLDALQGLAGGSELTLFVGHVNHGLRAAESDGDERAVAELCAGLGVPFDCIRVDPGRERKGVSNRERPTLQEAARRLRYRALAEMAERAGAEWIATAHNLDDQAETLLMRLFRGTGPDGMGGIPERSAEQRLVRPLLGTPRADIEVYAAQRGLCWREDSSNPRDHYTRNRLRRHWLPELAREFNPQLLRVLGNFAEAQRRDAEWMDELVDEAASSWLHDSDGVVQLERNGWETIPDAFALRLVRRALIVMGGGRDMSRTHLMRMLDFLRMHDGDRNGSTLELPGGLVLVRGAGAHTLRMSAARRDG